MENFTGLQTEQRNPRTKDIDVVSTLDMCRMINQEDATVHSAVAECLPVIANIIDEIAPRVARGGRVIYVGAGTSGRLGILDASEIPPTFSAPYGQFVGMMAGGDYAIRNAAEGAEDSITLPVSDLDALQPPIEPEVDSLIGLAASGRTPYVLSAMRSARERGCFTAGICCVSPSAMRETQTVVVECPVGPEVVTGSTRMKSGTAQKMILNMISTGIQIRVGKTYGNLMVDVKCSNEKLVDRARRIFRTVIESLGPDVQCDTPNSDNGIDSLIQECGGSVKTAVVAARWSTSPGEAETRLKEAGGKLKFALQ
ncbi:N-acetylmuramic acid-6-phosphate etherase [Naematelia encephala]|uniref:N-acetylmuramic acid-6-phosphate etherase n=1 Tax=Naematelia encephala TaxID=71784 RepID=A0A1Y2BME1_9TREE|nr:N-acetylmuramic acid-6-phosphate etherase [Naematelia encephala]